MKYSTPFILLLIPIGFVAIFLALLCLRYFDPAMSFWSSLFTGAGPETAEVVFYLYAVLLLLVCGALVGLGLIFFMKKEDRKHEQMWKATRPVYQDFSRTLVSINASIVKLQFISEKMKQYSLELHELSRQVEEKSAMAELNADVPETLTQGNNIISDLRIIHPLDELTPQEPSVFPQFHRRT